MEKITSLFDRLDRIRLMRASSPEPDALSVSLYQLGAEMNTLNDDGIEALMQELTEGDNTILTPEQARKFVDSFRR